MDTFSERHGGLPPFIVDDDAKTESEDARAEASEATEDAIEQASEAFLGVKPHSLYSRILLNSLGQGVKQDTRIERQRIHTGKQFKSLGRRRGVLQLSAAALRQDRHRYAH
jgi:hypothetical protein